MLRRALAVACCFIAGIWRRDADLAGTLFSTSDKDANLQTRRGDSLGYLVAQEAAQQYSVQALAKLDCRQSRNW